MSEDIPQGRALAERNRIETEILRLKRIKLERMEIEFRQREMLPHLHRYKFYTWAREFFESKNREGMFLVAANQLSKSSTAIRKIIHWSTEKSLWAELWPGKTPNLFWYFYPNFQLATTEFETKWMEFLPRDKGCPKYGWKSVYDKGVIQKIVFNSGIILQFRAYSQKLIDIQAASVYFVVADEEMPVHLYPEIKARTNATDGYFLMVFTATLGQDYWKQTMSPDSLQQEMHKGALKREVSLYDSQFYEDGSPSPWNLEKIKRAEANCPTEAEVLRRVHGKFVKSEGLVYQSFSMEKNISESHPLPKDWYVYGGIDPGTGGTSGHPTGIVFLAVNPTYTKARVFRGWRGDGIVTDSQTILNKFRELRKGLTMSMQVYDYAAADFFIVASSQGENLVRADKRLESGVAILNTLFKNQMLSIQRGDPELDKLISELRTLAIGKDKRHAKDDLIDPLRYICKLVPWDFSSIELPEELKEIAVVAKVKTSGESRRDWFKGDGHDSKSGYVDEELDSFNELLGTLD